MTLEVTESIDIDETKIDRCFVTRIQCNAYNYRLLNNIIELAHCAQIQVCCEGVETYFQKNSHNHYGGKDAAVKFYRHYKTEILWASQPKCFCFFLQYMMNRTAVIPQETG